MLSFVSRFSPSLSTSLSPTLGSPISQDDETSFQSPSTSHYALNLHSINSTMMPQTFEIPQTHDPIGFLKLHTSDSSAESRIKLNHGTTTLAFRFKGGIVVAVDSRATAGSYIGEGVIEKRVKAGRLIVIILILFVDSSSLSP
jgi:hypothetical protein